MRSRNASTAASVAGSRSAPIVPSNPSTPASVSRGAAATAAATARACSSVRQPARVPAELDQHAQRRSHARHRAPSRPRPSRRGSRRRAPGPRRARARASAISGAPTSWLARITRRAPAARITASCATVAAVIAHAPASSWRRISCGASVVLPCGASARPRSSHQPCIVAQVVRDARSRAAPAAAARGRRAAGRSPGCPAHRPSTHPRRRRSRGSDRPHVRRAALRRSQ